MKTIIAKNTQITDDFKNTSFYTSGNVIEYQNGDIKYDNNIYASFTTEQYQKNLNAEIYNKAKDEINRFNDYAVTKLMLLYNKSEILKDVISQISTQIITDDSNLDKFDGARKHGNYIFVKKDSDTVSDDDKENYDKSYAKQATEKIEEYQKLFIKRCVEIGRQVKQKSKTDSAQQLSIFIDKKQDQLHQLYQTYTTELTNFANKIDNKEIKKQIEKEIDQWENNEDKVIQQAVSKLREIKASDNKIMNIDGKERKVDVIGQKGNITIIKFFGSDKCAAIANNTLLFDNIDENNIKYYGSIKAVRVIADDEKILLPYSCSNKDQAFTNAFIVDGLEGVDPTFDETYFLLFNNGTIEIRKISDGLTGSAIVSAKTISKLKTQAKTNSQLQEYFEDGSTTTSTSPSSSSTTSSSTFDKKRFNRLRDNKKIEYLKSLGNVELKISDLGEATANKIFELKLNNAEQLANIKLAKATNIKISRKNRHLSLQQQMLNKIFKKL